MTPIIRGAAALACTLVVSASAAPGEHPFPELSGPYFGQRTPSATAELFAPGLISVNGRYEYALSFSPDGTQLFFTIEAPEQSAQLLHSRIEDGRWTPPEAVSLTSGAKQAEMEAFFSPDAKRIFFAPYDEGMDVRIWSIEVGRDGWHSPRELGPPVSDDPAFFPTSTSEGVLYYTNLAKRKIYKAQLRNGRVTGATDAGIAFGGHCFVAPDESLVLVDAQHSDSRGNRDIYVAFRNADGTWATPRNLGGEINTEHSETCPALSPDGKYLFFSRYNEEGELSNIYWISSSVIEDARRAPVVDAPR
jgi:Tol biopolymer transport system component